MAGASNSIRNFRDTATGFVDAGKNYVNEIGQSLDFGDVTPPPPESSRNSEIDTTTIDRSNPTNINFSKPLGIPAPVFYVGAAVLAIAALKKFKVL